MLEMSHNDEFELLRPINELLSKYLHRAILDTSKHYRECNYGYEPHTFAKDMRLLLKKMLTVEAEIYGFTIYNTGGDSFCLAFQGYTYRLYKSSDGRVPPPTDTDASMSFYNVNGKRWPIQCRFAEPGWEIQDAPPLENTSLVAYYDYDYVEGWHRLNWLKVACPRSATRSRVDPIWIIGVDIPLHVENTDSIKRSTKERNDLTFVEREDTKSSESDESSAATELTELGRDDITYPEKNEATLAEEKNDEDSSDDQENGTSTRQIE